MGNWFDIKFYTYISVSVVKFKDPLRHRQMKNRQLNRWCAEKRSLSSLSKAQENTPLVGWHSVVDRQVHSVLISKITDKITTCIRCTKAPPSSWLVEPGAWSQYWPLSEFTPNIVVSSLFLYFLCWSVPAFVWLPIFRQSLRINLLTEKPKIFLIWMVCLFYSTIR